MTTTVVEQAASGNNPVRPILLMLNCSDTAMHLGETNTELFDLYGIRIVRIALDVPDFYLSLERADNSFAELVVAEDERPSLLRQKLTTDTWLKLRLETVIGKLYLYKMQRRNPAVENWIPEHVRVVIIAGWMLEQYSLLPQVLPKLFPNASFRRINTKEVNAKPERLT